MEARALIFVSAADVATITYRLVAQALLKNDIVSVGMVGKVIISVTAAAGILLFLVVSATSPSDTGPVGILAVFFLLYILLTGFLTVVAVGINRFVVRISTSVKTRKPLERLSWRRAYYIASVIALGPVMLVGMGSVGRAGITEFTLVTIFVCIGLFYVEKRSR